jgi:hypothetical protein
LKNLFSFDLTRDSDGDGIPDWQETKFNLNPFNGQTNLTLPQPPPPPPLLIGVPHDWQGWTKIGRSDDLHVYGSGSTSGPALYDVYANQFYLNAASGTSNIPVGNQYVTGDPTGLFTYSPGAFTGGNRILGIGVRGLPGSNVSGFTPTVRFDLGNDSYSAATNVEAGRTSFSLYSHSGDFTVQFQPVQFGTSLIYRPSNITFRGGDSLVYTLPGGIGSGASYDFAFRAIPLTSSNSYQMFFDLTAMQRLYRDISLFQATFNRQNVLVAPGTNYNGQGIGTIGSTLNIALNGLSNNTTVFLVDAPPAPPVEMLVDANRDGTIDDSDRRKVSEAKPWSFWLNDDDDTNADTLGSQRADHTTGTVDGAKDLEDFFPVFLDIQELVKALPPKANPPAESVIYKLKQANGAVSFVETNLTREAAFSYKDSTGIGYGISLQQHAASATTTQVTAAGVELSEDFLNNVKDANKGVILIEGRAATDKPLVLTVEKGGVQVAEVSLPLAIAPRILLLLHGMNSNTYTWDDLVRAAFGGGPVIFADIRAGQFAPLTPATLPSFNRGSFGKGGVRCFRLQFGHLENEETATTGLPNEDDMGHPLTTVTAKGGVDGKNEPYLTTQVLKCGDFESFDELAQEVDEAITMLLARHRGAQIVLVGHSRGGLAGRKFLEGYATNNLETYLTNRKAVVGFLTTSSLHKGSLMGRIYQWLADHPKHVYDSAGNEVMVNVSGVAALPDYKPVNWQYWGDWRVVDFLKDPKTFGILNKASTLDVRRPVINDMSDRSQAIADINVENAVANLPASVRYGEIINSRVDLGVLTLGNLAGYSVFHSLKAPTMTTAARTYILGNEKVPGNFPGDGLVPRDSQVFTNLPGFPANGQNAVPSLYVTEEDVVHTDAPSRSDDIRAQLRLIVPTWFP